MASFDINKQARAWCLVIHSPDKGDEEALRSLLESLIGLWENQGLQFFAIFHNRDKQDDGTAKAVHCHVVLIAKNRVRLSSVLGLPVKSSLPDFIGARPCSNAIGAIRYLVHLDNPEKEAYNPDEIVTNNPLAVQEAVTAVVIRSARDLVDVVGECCGAYSLVLLRLGSEATKTYHLLIRSLCWDYAHKKGAYAVPKGSED